MSIQLEHIGFDQIKLADDFHTVVALLYQLSETVMAEETALASPLTKLKGGDKRRTVESPRSSVSIGKGVAHGCRGSIGSSHELIKKAENDELVSEAPKSRPLLKPVMHIGVTAVVRKNVVVKPKPLVDGKIELPVTEKGKQEIVTTSEHVDVHIEQSASDIMMIVTGESKISEGTEASLLCEERVTQEILVASEIKKVTAEETSSETKDLDLFKKSCSLSKEKPTLLRLPSLISTGSKAGWTIDAQKSVDGKTRVAGKKVLQGRNSFNGRKHSDESKKTVDTEITPNGDGNTSNVDFNSADELMSTEGSKKSPAKKVLEKSKSLNLKTSIKDGGLVNAKNNGKSETLKEHVAAPKPKILSMRPSRSLNSVAVKPSSLIYPSSGSRIKTSGDDQEGRKVSTSNLYGKKVSTPTMISPSSSSPSVNGEEKSDAKKLRVVRVLPSVRRQSKITKVAAKDFYDQGIKVDTVDGIKLAPEKISLASTKMKMTSTNSSLSPVPSVSKSTPRSRISYLPSRNKKLLGETEQKITVKDASPSSFRNGKAADGEFENQRPSKLKVRSTTTVAETTQRRSYLKRDGPAGDFRKNSSEKFLPGRSSVRRKKNVLSNKVIEETANRLIRTRKSKVLALIGAFETVISIQKKSSARATSKAKKRISTSKVSC